MKLFLVTRLVSAILAVVIGTAAVGGGAVWAAGDSLPGDFIYPVKLTVEDLRMDLARTPEAQVDLALQFAEERAAEIQAMVQTGLPVSEQVTARMEQHFQHALHQAAWAPEKEMPGLLERIARRAQTQVQVLEQVRAMAPEETRTTSIPLSSRLDTSAMIEENMGGERCPSSSVSTLEPMLATILRTFVR